MMTHNIYPDSWRGEFYISSLDQIKFLYTSGVQSLVVGRERGGMVELSCTWPVIEFCFKIHPFHFQHPSTFNSLSFCFVLPDHILRIV